MKPRNLLDKEKLDDLYNQQKLSINEVSKILGCCAARVYSNLIWNDFHIRNKSEARIGKSPWNKGLTKETNKSLMSVSEKNSKNRIGRVPPNKGKIRNDKIIIKIVKKQFHISTDYDLSSFGYRKQNPRSNGAIDWVLIEHANEIVRDRRKEDPDKFREYGRRNYEHHKQSYMERTKRWSKTKKGRISRAKQKYKHNQKGFVPLNTLIDIPSDWHHLHPQLPFVLSIDREIHRKYNGKKHYDSVNKEIGLNEIVGKSKEDIEYYIELNYPDEFKIYWFGNY